MNENAQKILAILFYKGEPQSRAELMKLSKLNKDEVDSAISEISARLPELGLGLTDDGKDVLLTTGAKFSDLITNLRKEEIDRELSKATLETLAIILYRGPIKRSEIDFIRGVNSQFIIRNLFVRGLIEKETDPKDERVFLYKASIDLLNHLGISNIASLPDRESLNQEIERFINEFQNEGTDKPTT